MLADTSIHSSEYAFVSGFHESLSRRGRNMTERPGETVNFSAIVRKSLPEHFPDFDFDTKQLRLSKRLLPAIQFWFAYRKNQGMMGKMFGIEVGVSLDSEIEFSTSIFRFFGTDFDRPTWVYHTQEELRLCLAESLQMLSKVLPAFQQSLSAYMSIQGNRRPKWMQVQRASSSRLAFEESLELAGVIEKEMGLQGISALPRIFDSDISPRPWTTDGVLNPAGLWRIYAHKKDDPFRTLMIEYPYEGPLRFGWKNMSGWSPPIEKWIDSTEAVDRMRSLIGTNQDPTRLQLGGYDPPRWVGSLGRLRHLAIDASSGSRID